MQANQDISSYLIYCESVKLVQPYQASLEKKTFNNVAA